MTSIHNNYQYNRSSGSNTSVTGSSGTQKQSSSTTINSLRGRTESPAAQRKYPNTGQVANAISRLPASVVGTQRPIKSGQNSTTPTSNYEYYGQANGNIICNTNGYLANKTSLSTRRSSFKSLITDDLDELKAINQIKTQTQQLIKSDEKPSKPNKYTSVYTNLSQPTTKDNLTEKLILLDLKQSYLTNQTINTSALSAYSNGSSSNTHHQTSINNDNNSSNMRSNQSSSSTRQANLKISMGIRAGSASSTTNENVNDYRSHQQVGVEFYSPAAANIITSSSSSSSYKSSNQMPSSSSLSSSSSSATKYNTNNNESKYETGLESKGAVGLKNLGNTCFMNSILQCLSNTKCLLEYCVKNVYTDDINTTLSVMKGSLFNAYASLIKTMWKSDNIVSPQDFKSQIARFAPRFVGYAQQDAEEFLYYLIRGLHEDVNLVKKKPSPLRFDEKAWDRMSDAEKSEEHWEMNLRTDKSRISDTFVGQLKSTLKCTKCDYKSPTFELFWHLALPIPTKSSSIKLDDCLKLFMSEEILDGDNKPLCSRCNEKRRCTKRYSIEKLPKILVIHLKRFSKIRYNNKINLNVDYPIESLDMSKYLSDNIELSSNAIRNCIYDLYGISLHSGTESSGHYVAYCKHPYKKRWYCYNDSQVREINHNALQDSDAYILFYQLRSSN